MVPYSVSHAPMCVYVCMSVLCTCGVCVSVFCVCVCPCGVCGMCQCGECCVCVHVLCV